ncbi:MAG: hypothetical protein PHH00_02380 [Candidatus Nanoarchaeia archaeon]|nr:hypothetical protein [Candidatus Nanoarchaeia archaeon]
MAGIATAEADGRRPRKPLWQLTIKLRNASEQSRDAVHDKILALEGYGDEDREEISALGVPFDATRKYDIGTHKFYQCAGERDAERLAEGVKESPLVEAVYIDKIR